TLPFDDIINTGVLLPLFNEICESGYDNDDNPSQIVAAFFDKFFDEASEKDRINLLFRFIQYIERQVVLFDAVEDAAFPVVNNMDGRGTLRSMKEEAEEKNKTGALKAYLEQFRIRTVLTAHPTQFYPGEVLGIITDLAKAIEKDDLLLIKKLMAQLGRTPFFKKEKPTPYDEAVRLIWYLENVFYHAAGNIFNYIQNNIFGDTELHNNLVNLGFWPGGDRDGNPFVTAEITLKVAERLKTTVLKNYYRDVRRLKRRITFYEADRLVEAIESKLYDAIYNVGGASGFTCEAFYETLLKIRQILIEKHKSLFVEEVNDLINKTKLFGFHFAALDIRQDSRVHHHVITTVIAETRARKMGLFPENYETLPEAEKAGILGQVKGELTTDMLTDEITRATLGSVYAMKTIQRQNGEPGCNRYIISNNQSMLNVMEVFAMIRLCGWENPAADIVPLFETVDDLQRSKNIMEALYNQPDYAAHLKRRGNKQTIMLG
ncbi:MAG: phosphoenolpyruvate carboxylase, partial [Sinomicrobium sp.]|nr:phosphoenolpyruvate carboxylase [Sinomicrobium sp.]